MIFLFIYLFCILFQSIFNIIIPKHHATQTSVPVALRLVPSSLNNIKLYLRIPFIPYLFQPHLILIKLLTLVCTSTPRVPVLALFLTRFLWARFYLFAEKLLIAFRKLAGRLRGLF